MSKYKLTDTKDIHKLKVLIHKDEQIIWGGSFNLEAWPANYK